MRPRHRLSRLLRTAVLMLLALCMALQPVLAAAGELHEISEHAEAAALHLTGDGPWHDPDGGGTDPQFPGEALHLLLHYAHCCGNASGLTAARLPPVQAPAFAPPTLPGILAPAVAERPGAPFRPPITG